MIVTNNTFVDSDMSLKMLLESTKRTIRVKYWYAGALLIIAFLIFGLSFTTESQKILYQVLSYAMMGLSVIMVSYFTYQYIKAPIKVEEANKESFKDGLSYQYRFREQYFQVTCKSNNKVNKVEYDYKNVRKCYEYDTFYQMRLKDSSIVIIDKSGFENSRMIEYFIKNVTLNKVKIINKIEKGDNNV